MDIYKYNQIFNLNKILVKNLKMVQLLNKVKTFLNIFVIFALVNNFLE